MGAVIIGCGKAVPKLEVANDGLSELVDTSDEWIRTRTGISSRHISVDETTLDLAQAAACAACNIEYCGERDIDSMHAYGSTIDLDTIDLIVFPTITPDSIVPAQACALKRALGIDNAIAFDVNAACSGFLYGLCVAESMMAASHNASSNVIRNRITRALVVSSERLSRLTDWSDRTTCVLFGDGAGAAVVEWQDGAEGILATYLKNDDDVTNSLTCLNQFTTPQPFNEEGIDKASASKDRSASNIDRFFEVGLSDDPSEKARRQAIRMDGQTVFKFASKAMSSAVEKVVDDAGFTLEDIALIIPHQANERIISYAAKRLSLPLERFQVSIATTGNTSSSGEPMALADAYYEGKIKKGDLIVLVAFGGGLTSGAILLRA